MHNIFRFSCIVLFSLSAMMATAQEQISLEKNKSFSLSGQLRSRFEYRDGDFRPLSKVEDPAALVLNRIRLNLDYTYADLLVTKISFQNVNIWGQANPVQTMDKSGNTLSVFEAWADLKIYKNLRAKVGRQMIVLDDERLFGASDWTNSARAHDALSINFEKNKFKVQSFFAFNQNYDALDYNNNPSNPSGNLYQTRDAQSYKLMQTIWGKYNLDRYAYFSVLFSNIGYQNTDSITTAHKINNLQTMGINYFFNYPKIFGNISGYYQMGKSDQGLNTNAYLFSASIGAKIKNKWNVSIGSDYLSGNELGKPTDKNEAFLTLFGTGHKFYGNMDYFYAGNPHKSVGLLDNFLKVQYDFHPKLKMNLDGHLFYSPTKISANNKKYGANLGQEIDFKLAYKAQKFVNLSAGYSAYFTDATLLFLKNVNNAKPTQNWAWLSIDIQPEFFKVLF